MSDALGDKLGGSALKIIALSSPVALNAGGSTQVVNASGFKWGTIIINAGSTAALSKYKITRSSTSAGTFGDTGASLQFRDASANAYARSFSIDTSNVYLRGEYDITGATSPVFSATLILAGSLKFPVDQDSRTTISSDIVGG